MTTIRAWLHKKKTYFSAGALALVACLGYFGGVLDETNALALLTFAGGLAGLGAKSQRTADQIRAALDDVRNAQARAAAQHNPIDVRQLAVAVAKEVAPAVVSCFVSVPAEGASAAVQMPTVTSEEPTIAGQEPAANSQEPMEAQR